MSLYIICLVGISLFPIPSKAVAMPQHNFILLAEVEAMKDEEKLIQVLII